MDKIHNPTISNDTIDYNGSDHNDGAKAKDDTHISATYAVQTDISSDVFLTLFHGLHVGTAVANMPEHFTWEWRDSSSFPTFPD